MQVCFPTELPAHSVMKNWGFWRLHLFLKQSVFYKCKLIGIHFFFFFKLTKIASNPRCENRSSDINLHLLILSGNVRLYNIFFYGHFVRLGQRSCRVTEICPFHDWQSWQTTCCSPISQSHWLLQQWRVWYWVSCSFHTFILLNSFLFCFAVVALMQRLAVKDSLASASLDQPRRREGNVTWETI